MMRKLILIALGATLFLMLVFFAGQSDPVAAQGSIGTPTPAATVTPTPIIAQYATLDLSDPLLSGNLESTPTSESALPMFAGGPNNLPWNPPPPKETPPPPGGGVTTIISQTFSTIVHNISFPAYTISEALLTIFRNALRTEQNKYLTQMDLWVGVLATLFSGPVKGGYAAISADMLKIAAGLAPALFILRLAIYNWNRLIGEQDDALRAVGDWLTASVLAIIAGPLLDQMVSIGFWMMNMAVGSAGNLAKNFVHSITVTDFIASFAMYSFFGAIIAMLLLVAALLAVAGLVLAFASSQAALFLLAAVGPVFMLAGVIPQMRWLRGLWLKAAVVVCLLPLLAGIIFRVGIDVAVQIRSAHLLALVFRIIWLFGATGMLLAVSGTLAKMTFGTAAETFGKMVKAGKAVIDTAVLAGSTVASGGIAAGAAGVGALGGAGAVVEASGGTMLGAGSGSSVMASVTGGLPGALGSLAAAQASYQKADAAQMFGLDRTAARYRSEGHQHEVAARQAELEARMQRSAGSVGYQTESGSNFGYSPSVNQAISSTGLFPGPEGPGNFHKGVQLLEPYFNNAGLNITTEISHHPSDIALMSSYAAGHEDELNSSENPLWMAAEKSGASRFRSTLDGRNSDSG